MIIKHPLNRQTAIFLAVSNQTGCSAISKAISLGLSMGQELPTEGAARSSCRLWGVVIGWGKIQVAMVTHLLVGCGRRFEAESGEQRAERER